MSADGAGDATGNRTPLSGATIRYPAAERWHRNAHENFTHPDGESERVGCIPATCCRGYRSFGLRTIVQNQTSGAAGLRMTFLEVVAEDKQPSNYGISSWHLAL